MIKFIALQRFLSFLSLRQKPYFTRLRMHKLKAIYMEFEVLSSGKRNKRHIQIVNRILSEPCPSLSSVGDSAG